MILIWEPPGEAVLILIFAVFILKIIFWTIIDIKIDIAEGNEFYFRTCFLDPFQGKVMAQYAIEKGNKKAAIITQIGDDYSTGLGNFFKEAFTKLNFW